MSQIVFDVVSTLGVTAHSKVKLAQRPGSTDLVVVKILHKSCKRLFDRPEYAEFMRWVDNRVGAIRRVHHPNVAQILDVIDDPTTGRLMVVMQHVKGGSIFELSAAGCCRVFSEERTCYVARQICSALMHLQRRGMAHCAIKPGNVLLDDNQSVLVSDIGGGSWYFFVPPFDIAASHPTTAGICPSTSGATYGSSAEGENGWPPVGAYMASMAALRQEEECFLAPEWWQAETCPRFDLHSVCAGDIWALGVLLRCMIVGKLPAVESKKGRCPDAEALKIPPGVCLSSDARDFFDRVLQPHPDQRATLQELRRHPWLVGRCSLAQGRIRVLGLGEAPSSPMRCPCADGSGQKRSASPTTPSSRRSMTPQGFRSTVCTSPTSPTINSRGSPAASSTYVVTSPSSPPTSPSSRCRVPLSRARHYAARRALRRIFVAVRCIVRLQRTLRSMLAYRRSMEGTIPSIVVEAPANSRQPHRPRREANNGHHSASG